MEEDRTLPRDLRIKRVIMCRDALAGTGTHVTRTLLHEQLMVIVTALPIIAMACPSSTRSTRSLVLRCTAPFAYSSTVRLMMLWVVHAQSREDVLKMGVGVYNDHCRSIVQQYAGEWETRITVCYLPSQATRATSFHRHALLSTTLACLACLACLAWVALGAMG